MIVKLHEFVFELLFFPLSDYKSMFLRKKFSNNEEIIVVFEQRSKNKVKGDK